LNYLPLLLCTLDAAKFDLQWGFDSQTGEVRTVKIMQFEIAVPPETITADVLWHINTIRGKLRESLTPWSKDDSRPDTRSSGKGGSKGRYSNSTGSQHIWVGDISAEMGALLEEIWPTPDPVERWKSKVLYCSAAGELDEDDEGDPEVLTSFYPLAEEMDWSAMNNVRESESKKSKNKKGNQNDGLGNRPNVSKADLQAVKGMLEVLWSKPYPHEEKLSSLCGRFPGANKKLLQKFTDIVSITQAGNEFLVRATGSGGNGWHEEHKSGKKAKGGKGGGSKESKGGGKGARNAKNDALDGSIADLCRLPEIAVEPVDFDSRVRTWFVRFQQRRGQRAMDNAFDELGKWLTKKERAQVRSWPSYLMVLLRNWERNEFEGEAEHQDSQR